MNKGLPQTSVVVVASQFNPSIVTQYWLIKNSIFAEEDFTKDCMFSAEMVNIVTDSLNIRLSPKMLTAFLLTNNFDRDFESVNNKITKILNLLPETPFDAVGMNFMWRIDTEDKAVSDFGKSLFFKSDSKLFEEFNTEDAGFGAYMSKNVLGCRLKMEIKPVFQVIDNNICSRMQFVFNFHLDLTSENKSAEILEFLAKWKEASLLSSKILSIAVQ